MLSNLYITLVKVLLSAFLFLTASLRQLQQYVILDILQLNRRDPALNDPLPECIHMHLHQRHRSDQQIITSTYQIDIQQQMVPYQTVNPLIIRYGVPWPELNDYFFGAVPA